MPDPDTRTQLLEAASQLLRREGALALTLERVAREAKLSKGGLLYHFPNKEALLRGVLHYHLEQFEQALEDQMQQHQITFAQAYVRLGSYDGSQGLALGFVAVIILHPPLLVELQQTWNAWNARASQTGERIALLATDGLWWASLLGLELPDSPEQHKILERLEGLALEGSGTIMNVEEL